MLLQINWTLGSFTESRYKYDVCNVSKMILVLLPLTQTMSVALFGDGTVNLKFSDLPFSPVICCLFHRLARQLPVIAKIHCFRVSEQHSLKLPRWWNTQPLPPSSSHSFPITPPWDSFSSSLLFMFFSAYFLWTLLFFPCHRPSRCVLKPFGFCYQILFFLFWSHRYYSPASSVIYHRRTNCVSAAFVSCGFILSPCLITLLLSLTAVQTKLTKVNSTRLKAWRRFKWIHFENGRFLK